VPELSLRDSFAESSTRKKFTHRFVEKISLTSETTDAGRYYSIPDGRKLPSVTTVLGRSLDHAWLDEWRERVGAEEADKISKTACYRGSKVHDMAERYVLNQDYMTEVMPLHAAMFKPIKKVLDERVDNVLGIELALFSTALNTAGRTDLVAEFNGVTSIIDYKTSKRMKGEADIEGYFLQSTVYSLMFERIYSIETRQIVILITVENAREPLVFVKDRNTYVKRVLEIFKR
jgi:hypothetical protein